MKRLAALLLTLMLALLPIISFGSEAAAPELPISPVFKDSQIPQFPLASEDLLDGVWNSAIAKNGGENVSPQLSWEPVPDAACYVIYMVDTKVLDFVHWMSNNVTETSLPQGWAPQTDYIGPYPPAFETHTYDVYVLALKQPVENLKSIFNAANVFFAKNVMYLDAPAEDITGNLLGYGYLSGTYRVDE